jgi:DNA-binding transcriptional LysR family regulator
VNAYGIGFITEWFIERELASGALVPGAWCQSFGGLHLYYSGHRFVPARLRALIDLIHELRFAGAGRMQEMRWP